jgi:hypothetical protein
MRSQCDVTIITCVFSSYGDFSYIVLLIVSLPPTCLPRSNAVVLWYPFISIQTSEVLLVGLLIIHHCRQPPTLLLGVVREAASLAHLYSDTRISRCFLAHHRKPLSQRTRKPPFLVHRKPPVRRNHSEVTSLVHGSRQLGAIGSRSDQIGFRRNWKSLRPDRL